MILQRELSAQSQLSVAAAALGRLATDAAVLTFLIAASLLCGCAGLPNEGSGLVGYYAMVKGGYNESLNVEFARDGSYVLDHELFTCVIGPNGEMPITYGREEGVWKFEGGVVLLEPKPRTKDLPDAFLFVPALARRLVPKREGFSLLLVNLDYPDRFALKKTKKPNQSLRPTAPSRRG